MSPDTLAPDSDRSSLNGGSGSARPDIPTRWVLLGFIVLAVSCSTPSAIQRIQERHPDAQFEARLTGCAIPGESARRFGRDARTALLWSRERVRGARYFPCTARIRAVVGADTTDVYHLSLTRDGKYEEHALGPR